MGRINSIAALLAVLGLTACSTGGTPDLITLRSDGQGPDEFAILPNKPLQQPDDFTALPAPTPGGANRSDQTPLADAVAALGGRPGAAAAPLQGPALVSYTTRFGVQSDIRTTLAAEDLEVRRANDGRLLERLFGTNIYFNAYRRQELDQYRELERLRRAGVRTPAAPPEDAQ